MNKNNKQTSIVWRTRNNQMLQATTSPSQAKGLVYQHTANLVKTSL